MAGFWQKQYDHNILTFSSILGTSRMRNFRGAIRGEGCFEFPRRTAVFPRRRRIFLRRTAAFLRSRRMFLGRTAVFLRNMCVFSRKASHFYVEALYLRRTCVFLRAGARFLRRTCVFLRAGARFLRRTYVFPRRRGGPYGPPSEKVNLWQGKVSQIKIKTEYWIIKWRE